MTTEQQPKKCHKSLSNDAINGITFTVVMGVIVTGIVFWLTTLA